MTKLISETTQMPPEEFSGIERMHTIPDAARIVGVHTWALRRAVKSGAIPAYQPFNGRKLVRISEVVAAINASKIGG